MKHVTELNHPPKIGTAYLVDVALLSNGLTMPVIGDPHSDPDLNVDFEHVHPDPRFMSVFLMRKLGVQPRNTPELKTTFEQSALGAIRPTRSLGETYTFVLRTDCRPRVCVREMPEFPWVKNYAWQDLHLNYEGRKVKCGKCPHRGMPLGSLPQDENGHVICNGHGLRIDMKQRRVVSRFNRNHD